MQDGASEYLGASSVLLGYRRNCAGKLFRAVLSHFIHAGARVKKKIGIIGR
jgi:hypothetical protein